MTLAIVFDSVGAGEWLVLLAVLLVVMGPKRLPATARKIGSYYSKFRRAADSFKRQLMDMDYEMERELRKAEQEVEDAAKIPELNEEPGTTSGEDPGTTADEAAERDYAGEPAAEPSGAVDETGEEVHGD